MITIPCRRQRKEQRRRSKPQKSRVALRPRPAEHEKYVKKKLKKKESERRKGLRKEREPLRSGRWGNQWKGERRVGPCAWKLRTTTPRSGG